MNASSNCKCKCNCNCKCKCKRKKKVYRLPRVSPSVLSNRVDVCPPAIKPNEPPDCELNRTDLANASPIDLNNGWRIYFDSTLVSGSTVSNPAHCDNLTGDPEFNAPTVEQLANPFVQVELFSRGICPMVVWALNNGVPTLVELSPGDVHPVKTLPTPSLSCLAYTMCMDTTP